MKKYLFLFGITAVFFSACTTLQKDIFVDNHREQTERDLAKLEEMIIPLEAVGGTEARRMQSELTLVRRMIGEMEKEATADAYYLGRLVAWSGRLAILEGRYSESVRLHRQSQAVSAGNIPAIILGIRLEGDPAIRLELIERELAIAGGRSAHGFGELQIERASSLLELNRFAEAAGAFDSAFSSGLASVYNESYGGARGRAWELRNTSGVGTGTIDMLQDIISWNDCIAIAINETQLLRFISGGRNLNEAEFFNRLLERAFIPYTQDVNVDEWPDIRPDRHETVTRAGVAWFVWHLYAESRGDRGMLSRYSARFATGANPRSPIADIPPLSPFFDSILGCVETELLNLPDGRNFRPAQPIRGAELLAILQRIDN